MKILIAGGSGFIGSALSRLLKQKHHVTIISRRSANSEDIITWQDLNSVNGYDVVINLSGENIGEKRWTHKRKEIILNSRLTTTAKLANLCANADEPKPRFLNASAIGVYGLQQEELNELPLPFDDISLINITSPPDFLSEVAIAWEQATLPAVIADCAVTWLRFGVVLGKHGGALKKLLPAFKMGMGGIIGSGNQAFTLISLHDAIRAIEFIIDHQISGPICMVAPTAVTQRDFAKSLARALNRPCLLHLPRWLILALFGQMGDELLLRGQHVKPTRLQNVGFDFRDPTLEQCLKNMLH